MITFTIQVEQGPIEVSVTRKEAARLSLQLNRLLAQHAPKSFHDLTYALDGDNGEILAHITGDADTVSEIAVGIREIIRRLGVDREIEAIHEQNQASIIDALMSPASPCGGCGG